MALRSLASSDAVLSRRSRYGDRGAARRLAARHAERVAELSAVVTGGSDQTAALARSGFALALRGRRPFDDALVTAFGRLAAATADPDGARARLLVLLVEVEHRPLDEAAALLGLGADTADELLPGARSTTGLPPLSRHCRGWGLVARRRLTEAERTAGEDHVALCRRCRDRLAVLERTRAQLVGGTAGLATGLASAQLIGSGSSTLTGSGAGGILGSKAVAGVVAAVGGAVLVTGGTAAVAQQPSHDSGYRPAVGPAARPTTAPGCRPCPTPTPTPTSVLRLPTVQVPVTVPSPGLPLPAATVPPLPALPVPLPSLPVPLPSLPQLPLPLPTELPTLPLVP
ncbi:MAG TPA: hypothetical protein VL281_03710 [Mycobacteriales bacterium]|nr:hypothetical protein [Mycobacteriales bacterium]